MRDIARNFRALPLVSWMVWIAIAVIAAPVMALPVVEETAADTEIIESAAEREEELTAVAADQIAADAIADSEAASDIADSELEPILAAEDGAQAEENDSDAITHSEAALHKVVSNTDSESDSSLIAQSATGDLANPAEPFDFDERGVDTPDEGVLVPPSETAAPGESAAEPLEDGPLTPPSLKLQTAAIQEGDEFSARARVYGHYFLESNVAFVGAVDLSTGDAFSDTDSTGFDVTELYVVASPANMPELRGAVGLIELTSFFDRNSFAKDSLTHFINPVFQTNPALSVTQLQSQPAALVHWRPIDEVILKAAAFSSDGFDDLDINGVAGELGVDLGNLIVRGTYVSATDDGDRDGIPEGFQIARNGVFGTQEGDREVSYGINAEWFIPELNAGLFGRYGYQRNADLDISGNTYSFGINVLDLFMDDDRFGVGYGRQLSDDDQRQGDRPDVLETFYDIRLAPNARAGVSWQIRDEFSESFLGLRVRADWDLLELF